MTELKNTTLLRPITRVQAWQFWLIAALFYGLEFLQRVAPGIIAKPLMHSFHLAPTTLGFIISLYFYAYALAQIPAGILLDRFGLRYPLTIAAAMMATGTLLFATSGHLLSLGLARILVGLGSAFAYIGCLKAAKRWFPAHRFPLFVGLTNTFGVVGALFGQAPFSQFIHTVGWHQGLADSAWLGFGITILILLGLRDRPPVYSHSDEPLTHTRPETHTTNTSVPDTTTQHPLTSSEPFSSEQTHTTQQSLQSTQGRWLDQAKAVLSCSQLWLIGLYAGLMVAPVIAFAELWAPQFLHLVHHLSTTRAASLNSLIFVGIAIGGPVNGWLSKFVRCRKRIMLLGNVLALFLLLSIILIHGLPIWGLSLLLFSLGFFISSMLLSFTLATELMPQRLSATIIAFNNMLIMIVGAIFQPLIGWLLTRGLGTTAQSSGPVLHTLIHTHHWSATQFSIAVLCLPIALAINLFILYFIKESHCKNVYSDDDQDARVVPNTSPAYPPRHDSDGLGDGQTTRIPEEPKPCQSTIQSSSRASSIHTSTNNTIHSAD